MIHGKIIHLLLSLVYSSVKQSNNNTDLIGFVGETIYSWPLADIHKWQSLLNFNLRIHGNTPCSWVPRSRIRFAEFHWWLIVMEWGITIPWLKPWEPRELTTKDYLKKEVIYSTFWFCKRTFWVTLAMYTSQDNEVPHFNGTEQIQDIGCI